MGLEDVVLRGLVVMQVPEEPAEDEGPDYEVLDEDETLEPEPPDSEEEEDEAEDEEEEGRAQQTPEIR